MGNPFVHVELHTGDPRGAAGFYSQLLEWKMSDLTLPGYGEYTLLDVGAGTGGGIVRAPAGTAPRWLAYIDVADLEASTRKAKQLGGQVILPRTAVPGFGEFAVIADPTGAQVGLYQAARR